MMYGGNPGFLDAWLWMSAALLLVAGLVLIGAWAIGTSRRPDEDEAVALLRARFARGELDADAFEQAHRILRGTGPIGGRHQTQAIVGVVLVAAALVTALLAGALATGGAGWRFSGVVGPQMMVGDRAAPTTPAGPKAPLGPTAPVGPTVRVAATQFQPATMTITVGQMVRWINDDNVAHTVTAVDRNWGSGNLPPGGSYERRFDKPGKYAYICVDHPRVTGTIVVTR